VGSSPEVLVRVQNRQVTLRPIAGTRPRGDTPEEDLRLEQELLAVGAAVSATVIPLTPTQVLRDIVRKTQSYTACPLPTFANVLPPSQPQLQASAAAAINRMARTARQERRKGMETFLS